MHAVSIFCLPSYSPLQALQENGGAVALAAGGTFCLALTARGKVIVWGKIGGPAGQRGTRPAVAEIMGLPRITSIAAGQSHALMTDGERVWALGRYVFLVFGYSAFFTSRRCCCCCCCLLLETVSGGYSALAAAGMSIGVSVNCKC